MRPLYHDLTVDSQVIGLVAGCEGFAGWSDEPQPYDDHMVCLTCGQDVPLGALVPEDERATHVVQPQD